MNEDPIVAAVHKVREDLASVFDYDVHAIFSDVRRREADLGDRLVRQSQTQSANQTVHPSGDSPMDATSPVPRSS